MKSPFSLAIAAALFALATFPAQAQKETLGIAAVEATPALKEDLARQGKSIEMRRVLEGMDGHLISAFTGIRKYSVIARSDLSKLLREQGLGDSGNVDLATAAASGKIKGLKYAVVTSVDHFLDANEEMEFPGTGRKGIKRRLQISAQAKIYDCATGEILDAPNIPLEKVDPSIVEPGLKTDAKRNDEAMPALAKELAEKIAARTVDVIFPAKIIDKEDKLVTINRGDGMPIKVGEVWLAYGPTKTIKDPDSGAEIKRKGALLGKVKITSVEATYSQGDVVEGTGIVVGAVLNRP